MIGKEKPKEVKCSKCDEDIRHKGHDLSGTNQRGDYITDDLCKVLNQDKKKHKFYRKKKVNLLDTLNAFSEGDGITNAIINATKDLYLAIPDPIEGHHLITCEAVSDGKKRHTWRLV